MELEDSTLKCDAKLADGCYETSKWGDRGTLGWFMENGNDFHMCPECVKKLIENYYGTVPWHNKEESRRTTPHGRPIRDAAEMEHIECPYPPNSDIQNDSSSTIPQSSTTELEDTGTVPVHD